MFRALLRYGSQALLLLAPLVTLNWSVLNLWGWSSRGPTEHVSVDLAIVALAGPKQVVELQLRLLISGVALLFIFASEIFDLYLPNRQRQEFRSAYLQEQKVEWQKKLGAKVRINIMFGHRHWAFPVCRVFRWAWRSDNYSPPDGHFDVNLFFTEWQGLCGLAFRAGEAKFVDFRKTPLVVNKWWQRWPFGNQFHLWPSQVRKTARLRYVLSIPIMRESKSGSWVAVGVINLDAITDEGAEVLEKNRDRLIDYFVKYGKILACLK